MLFQNFYHHKKRKSRSRGSSARRVSRNKSKTNHSVDQSNLQRSVSCDQTTTIVDSKPSTSTTTDINIDLTLPKSNVFNGKSFNSKCIKKSENSSKSKHLADHEINSSTQYKLKKVSDENSLSNSSKSNLQSSKERSCAILTLANEVAEAAIVNASSMLRTSHKDNNKIVALEKEITLGVSSTSVKMVSEEDKLDSLCELLDRLDAQYGTNAASTSKAASNTTVDKETNNSFALENKSGASNSSEKSFNLHMLVNESPSKIIKHSPKKEILKAGLTKTEILNKEICNGQIKENDLTPEEKQSLRKARKEGKKQNKLNKPEQAVTIRKTENLEEGAPLLIKPEVVKEKSKADLKRDRREKQETQRASKEKNKIAETVLDSVKETHSKKKTIIRKKEPHSNLLPAKRLPLLGHLTPQIEEVDLALIHPAIRIAGLCMKDRTIDGCNARVLSALSAISALIEDYSTPLSCDLSRDLSDTLTPNITYLNSCRSIHEPMNNALRFVKREINNVDQTIPEQQAKEELLSSIKRYIDQNIILASKSICQKASKIIESGDVILTFGYSSLVLDTIKEASTKLKNISVIVVDKPVPASGANMLPALSALGIKLFYRIMPDITIIMSSVTKIIVEAEGVVLNGAVLGICGTAGLALEASIRSIPFIVLCHTYKFCNIDLTDSLVVNELGNPDDIMNNEHAKYVETFSNWRDFPTLNIVNLVYDVTPAEMVGVLVTERHIVPTTVVPTIIKKNFADILGHD